MDESEIVAVDIVALVEDEESGGPIVVLHDRQSNLLLPIWIGDPEARAIAIAMNNIATPRPLTHTLLIEVVRQMEGKLSRIVVDRIKNHTYFSSIYIETATQKNIKIDARPSDAIALGLEAHIPIFVAQKVMEEAGQKNPFPAFGAQPGPDVERKPARLAKKDFSQEDLKKLKELLERAREREKKSSED